ncbi:MAG TPA: hypothetical protein VEF07_11685 [Candidatus Binataceae bacterium]|nr:hypothetical protein [Candidatus Binataceae bacterium]
MMIRLERFGYRGCITVVEIRKQNAASVWMSNLDFSGGVAGQP